MASWDEIKAILKLGYTCAESADGAVLSFPFGFQDGREHTVMAVGNDQWVEVGAVVGNVDAIDAKQLLATSGVDIRPAGLRQEGDVYILVVTLPAAGVVVPNFDPASPGFNPDPDGSFGDLLYCIDSIARKADELEAALTAKDEWK